MIFQQSCVKQYYTDRTLLLVPQTKERGAESIIRRSGGQGRTWKYQGGTFRVLEVGYSNLQEATRYSFRLVLYFMENIKEDDRVI